jgi:hypothetical protein
LGDQGCVPIRSKRFSLLDIVQTQPPVHWVLGALSLVIKWLEYKTDYSLASSAEVKNMWLYASTPV